MFSGESVVTMGVLVGSQRLAELRAAWHTLADFTIFAEEASHVWEVRQTTELVVKQYEPGLVLLAGEPNDGEWNITL
eukprot:scaffold65712_cov64-Attheya_sp.AAC.3